MCTIAKLLSAQKIHTGNTMDSPRGPEHIPLLTYALIIVLAGWGGISSYLARLRSTPSMSFTFAEMIGEIIISGFAGLMAFFLAQSLGVNEFIIPMLSGIAGHMGARFLHGAEKWVTQKFFGDKS